MVGPMTISPTRRRVLAPAAVVALVGGVLAALGGFAEAGRAGVPDAAPGTAVAAGAAEVTVRRAVLADTLPGGEGPDEADYLLVHLTIRNVGSIPLTTARMRALVSCAEFPEPADDVALRDLGGVRPLSSAANAMAATDGLRAQAANPGLAKDVMLSWTLPPGVGVPDVVELRVTELQPMRDDPDLWPGFRLGDAFDDDLVAVAGIRIGVERQVRR